VRGTKSQYRYKNISGVEEDDIIFQVFDGVETSDFAKISLKLDKNNTQVSSTVNKANSKPSTKTVRSSKPRTQVKPVAKPKPTRVPSQQQTSNKKDDGGPNMLMIVGVLLLVVLAAAGGGGGGGSDPTGGVDIDITIP
jgi:cobalamin biosynthesis Mg chelatase CobN